MPLSGIAYISNSKSAQAEDLMEYARYRILAKIWDDLEYNLEGTNHIHAKLSENLQSSGNHYYDGYNVEGTNSQCGTRVGWFFPFIYHNLKKKKC